MLQRAVIPFLLVLIVLATSWSLVHPELFKVHDYVHSARVAEMARGLLEGQLPVRWSGNFGYGYGMPLFEFYAPLPYFVGALLWMMQLPIELVIKLLFIIPSAITVYAAYRWGRYWLPELGAVVMSAAVALAPYRAVNLFVRGAVAEAWGMAFLVVSLWGVSAVVRQKKHSWLLLIIGLTGMILSHNLTTLMSIPALAIWTITAVVLESRTSKLTQTIKSVLPSLAGAVLLAVGITAFYWLPALTEKQYTQMDSTILTGYFDFRLHFLYARQFLQPFWGYGGSNWGPVDGISFFLGFGQILGTGLTFVMAAFLGFRALGKQSSISLAKTFYVVLIGSAMIIAFALFFSLQRSLPIWEAFSLLHVIQFPWRFLSVASTFVGVLTALWLLHTPVKWQRIGSIIILIVLVTNARYFQPSEYLTNSEDLYYTDAGKIRSDMSGILPDFIPKTTTTKVIPTSLVSCVVAEHCGVVEVLVDRGHEKLVRLTTTQASEVTLATASYPGWRVQLDGEDQQVNSSKDGLLSIPIPAGTHLIGWHLGYTTNRAVADVISVLAFIGLIYAIVASFEKHIFVPTNNKNKLEN